MHSRKMPGQSSALSSSILGLVCCSGWLAGVPLLHLMPSGLLCGAGDMTTQEVPGLLMPGGLLEYGVPYKALPHFPLPLALWGCTVFRAGCISAGILGCPHSLPIPTHPVFSYFFTCPLPSIVTSGLLPLLFGLAPPAFSLPEGRPGAVRQGTGASASQPAAFSLSLF